MTTTLVPEPVAAEQRTLGISLPTGRQVLMQVPADMTDFETRFLITQIATLPEQLAEQVRKPKLEIAHTMPKMVRQ